MKKIAKTNQLVKLAKSLSEKKFRDKHSLFLLEGPHLIEEALKVDYNLKYVIFSDKADRKLIAKIESKNIQTYFVDENVLNSISSTENSQGIIAVAPKILYNFEDLKFTKSSVFVICDSIQDPGNLGTIIRTCAAVEVSAVILTGLSVDIFNPKTVRSSSGAIFHIPIVICKDAISLLKKLEKNKIKVYCAESHGGENIFNISLTDPFAIVIGNEGKGIQPNIKDYCQKIITIPLNSNIESLNAAISCAIILFESYRQKLCQKKT